MITKTDNRTRLAVSGLTYDFTFRIDVASDLEVYGIDADGVATELTTGFSVSFSTADEEGTVTFDAEPSTYSEILMLRNRPYTQDTDIPIRGGFSEEDIEGALDAIVIQIQQLKELVDFAVKQDPTAVQLNIVFPAPEDGLAVAWDGVAGAMRNLPVDTAGLADAQAAAEAAQEGAETAQVAAEAAASSIATKATQAQAEAASSDAVFMTPLQVKNEVQKAGAVSIPADNIPTGFGTVLTGKENGTAYQAATDGFAYVNYTAWGGNYSIAILTDAANPPTTQRMRITAGDDTNANPLTLLCPVESGKYYKIQVYDGSNNTVSGQTGMNAGEFWPLN